MTQPSNADDRMMFVNLPVRDLQKSMQFFRALGFDFNAQYTNGDAACMIVGRESYVMFLTEPFFGKFTKRQPCDTSTHTEALIAISCASREDVDEMVKKAISGGGSEAGSPQDYGFMYSRSFYDLDGHHWEPMWTDPKGAEA